MSRQAEAGAVAFGEPDPAARQAGARGRASIVTTDRPRPAVMPPVSRTESDRRKPSSGFLAGAHVTSQLPSLTGARQRVHEHAAKFDGYATIKLLRLLWGYGWLGLKAFFNGVEWLAECPSRLLPVLILGVLAYFLTPR